MNEKMLKKVMSELGKRSAAKLTPAQRKAKAIHAITTRWAKHKEKKNVVV
jgi:hypothetical protein